jgi:hypothetical protein
MSESGKLRDPSLPSDEGLTGRHPTDTGERRVAGWQRALRWVAWLTFLGLAVKNSQSVYFSPLEWLALAAAIGISIWCMAKPLGGPKMKMTKPTHLLGAFVSRTSWALVLFGAILTIGGIGATGAIVYDLSTGRATFGDVMRDIAIFLAGFIAEVTSRGGYDAGLENTHAYALFLLLLPGVLLVWLNLIPFFRRGREWRVEPDGSVAVHRGDTWAPLLEYEYATVAADGTTIRFTSPPGGPQALALPPKRVYSREFGCRLRSDVSSAFFRQRLADRGFSVEPPPSDGTSGDDFTAARRA